MGAQDQPAEDAKKGRGIDPSLGVALGVVAISFAPVFVEGIKPEELGPTGIALWRTALGGVALLVLAVARRERLRPTRAVLGFALLAGALFAGDLWVWHRAIHRVGGGLATLLGNVQVFWTGLVGAFVFHERSGKRLLAAVPLAVAGLALATGMLEGGASRADPVGLALGLSTSVFYATYLLAVRRAQRLPDRLGPVAQMTWTSFACAATCALLALVDGSRAWPTTTSAWALAAGLGVVGQGFGWVTIATFVPRVPVGRAGLLLLLQPAFSLVWAAWFFGRHLTALQTLGAVLTLAAIYVGSTARYPRSPAPAAPAD
ncbi:MAG: DMT family transporter [Planctomycetia bacterium]|nr:DMT family transporter [Planctomycetia bacterium]